MKEDTRDSSTPQSSVVSSVIVMEKVLGNEKSSGEALEGTRKRYLERVRDLDLKGLACRQELNEVLELKSLSREDLSSHYCVDWLRAHNAHFSRERTLETADLTGVPRRSIFSPISYRPLKELGSLGAIAEPLKDRTGLARVRVAIPAQLRAVEKLPDLKTGLPDIAYAGSELSNDAKYGRKFGASKLAKALAAYDCSDPGVVTVTGSDFAGTSGKMF